jgi:hypothetical protein
MLKRFFITTALEETWCENEPILFLSDWCQRYSRRGKWSKMDAEILPYHWGEQQRVSISTGLINPYIKSWQNVRNQVLVNILIFHYLRSS